MPFAYQEAPVFVSGLQPGWGSRQVNRVLVRPSAGARNGYLAPVRLNLWALAGRVSEVAGNAPGLGGRCLVPSEEV